MPFAMQNSSQVRRTVQIDERLLWLTSLVSLSAFVLSGRFGTVAMAMCLLSWLPLVAAWPAHMLRATWQSSLPWAFPMLTLVSVSWSIEPALSLRLSTELIVFTTVALVIAGAQSFRSTLSALLLALLLGAALSVVLNQDTIIYTTGEVAMTGIFVSKNNLANFMCLLLLTACAVLGDRKQPSVFRILALVCVPVGLLLLAKAHSLGALVAGSAGVATVASVIMYEALPPRTRGPTLMVVAVCAGCISLTVKLALDSGFDLSQLLASFGKDTSLTGRTFLWSRAQDYIGERPLLGVGYQAFWVQGHVEAEGLWRYAKVLARAGFHFHNLFYETAVELGWTGVLILGFSLLAVTFRAIRNCLTAPSALSGFCAGLVVYFGFRVYVELDFIDPFSPGSLFLPLLWSVCSQPQREAAGRTATAVNRGTHRLAFHS